jgi:hypothetical protein
VRRQFITSLSFFLLLLMLTSSSFSYAEDRLIRVFDGSGLFRAQRSVKDSGAVEVTLDDKESSNVQLFPFDFVGDPLLPVIDLKKNGKLSLKFWGVAAGSWEIRLESKKVLEVKIFPGALEE